MLEELLLSGLRKDLEVALGIRLRIMVGYVESDTRNRCISAVATA